MSSAEVRTGDAARLYQLKIVLREVAPTVWRRLRVPASRTLSKLHDAIQIVMNWEGYHLHQFDVGGVTYGSYGLPGAKPDNVPLAVLVPPVVTARAQVNRPIGNVRSVFLYEYDMGDLWQLEIRVEKVLKPNPKVGYPCCLAGAQPAPPADCGGPGGYRHLQHTRRRREKAFDADAVNDELLEFFHGRERVELQQHDMG